MIWLDVEGGFELGLQGQKHVQQDGSSTDPIPLSTRSPAKVEAEEEDKKADKEAEGVVKEAEGASKHIREAVGAAQGELHLPAQ